MSYAEYFRETKGTGILSTANSKGEVNAAIYSRPHFLKIDDDKTFSFIMRDRLTHKYLTSNPRAFYTFIEKGNGYKGRRFPPEVIKSAIRFSKDGLTLKQVVKEIESHYGVRVGESTVHDWIKTYGTSTSAESGRE